jgi:hypothetical protein
VQRDPVRSVAAALPGWAMRMDWFVRALKLETSLTLAPRQMFANIAIKRTYCAINHSKRIILGNKDRFWSQNEQA